MKPIHLGIIAVILVIGYLAFSMQSEQTAPMQDETMPTEEVMVDTVMSQTIELNEQSDLGQSGQAVITEDEEGMAVVALALTGGEFPEPQPAHIHVGSCPDPGAVEYPLTNVVDGMSETVLDVSYEELMQATEPMAINVHKSAAEASVYTACGDLN